MVPPSSVETHHQIVWISLSIKNITEAGWPPLLRGPEMMLFDHEACLIDCVHDTFATSLHIAYSSGIEEKCRDRGVKTLCHTVVHSAAFVGAE